MYFFVVRKHCEGCKCDSPPKHSNVNNNCLVKSSDDRAQAIDGNASNGYRTPVTRRRRAPLPKSISRSDAADDGSGAEEHSVTRAISEVHINFGVIN